MLSLSYREIDAFIAQQAAEGANIEFQHNGQYQCIMPGLYFGMPEDLYHAIPALSSTGLKNLLISAPDFYFNSWLNPLRDEDQEDGDSSEWRRFGKAAHTRVLEGRAVFDSLYCVEFLAPEGCLKTIDDMRSWVTARGMEIKGYTINGKTPSKWSKTEWIQFIQQTDANALIFDIEEAKYYRETGGKIQLTEKEMRRIELAAAMIEAHPEYRHAFKGGCAEVSIVWIEPGADGMPDIWFKARFDFLKPLSVIDLKTFTNKRHKPIDMALHEEMAAHKYHIQVAHYLRAALWASGFARQRVLITTYGVDRFGPSSEFLDRLGANTKGHDFYNMFLKKGGAPLARCKKIREGLNIMACATASIDMAVALFHQYSDEFGSNIWVDKSSTSDFDDDLFPSYMTQI